MNTQEINDAAWPTTSYVAVAIPLTVVSVLLPLTALSLLRAMIRLSSLNRLRQVIKWGVILTSLVLNIITDFFWLLRMPGPDKLLYFPPSVADKFDVVVLFGCFVFPLVAFLGPSIAISLVPILRRSERTFWRASLVQLMTPWNGFVIIVVITYFAIYSHQAWPVSNIGPFFELIPYCMYFVGWILRRKKW